MYNFKKKKNTVKSLSPRLNLHILATLSRLIFGILHDTAASYSLGKLRLQPNRLHCSKPTLATWLQFPGASLPHPALHQSILQLLPVTIKHLRNHCCLFINILSTLPSSLAFPPSSHSHTVLQKGKTEAYFKNLRVYLSKKQFESGSSEPEVELGRDLYPEEGRQSKEIADWPSLQAQSAVRDHVS